MRRILGSRCCFFHLFICFLFSFFFFFNDTATTEIYTLSLHDALPISDWATRAGFRLRRSIFHSAVKELQWNRSHTIAIRSEEHTSELQSHSDLVCRLLLEKKKKKYRHATNESKHVRRAQDHPHCLCMR